MLGAGTRVGKAGIMGVDWGGVVGTLASWYCNSGERFSRDGARGHFDPAQAAGSCLPTSSVSTLPSMIHCDAVNIHNEENLPHTLT